jgi:hypothetical protein
MATEVPERPNLVEEQASKVLATLDDANAATLFAFAEGLGREHGPASRFHLPVYYLAGNRERGESADGLTLLTMRSAIRDASRDSVHRRAQARQGAVLGCRS